MRTKIIILLSMLIVGVEGAWAEQVTTPKVSPVHVEGTPTRYLYTFTVCQAGSNRGKVWSLHGNGGLTTTGTTTAEKFVFENSGTDGAYYIKSVSSGKYLFRAGDNKNSVVELNTAKSLWYVVVSTASGNYANTVKICPSNADNAVGVNSNNLYAAAQGGNGNSWWIMDETSETGANYTVSITGVPEGETATVSYGGTAYHDGDTDMLVFGTPAPADFTPSVYEGYTSSVSISGTTVTVTYTDYVTPRTAEYLTYLSFGGKVGYPSTTSDGYTNFKAAYDEFKDLPNDEKFERLQQMETLLTAYMAETNLTQPIEGHIYTLKHVIDAKNDDTKYHLLTSDVIGANQSGSATIPTVASHTGQSHYWMAVKTDDADVFGMRSNENVEYNMNFHWYVKSFSLIPGTQFGRVSLVKGTDKKYRICASDAGLMSYAQRNESQNIQSANSSSDWIIEEAEVYIYAGSAIGENGALTGTFTHTKNTNKTTAPLGGFMVLPEAAEASEFSVSPTTAQEGQTHINIENSVAANYHNVYWSFGTIATKEGEAQHPEWEAAGTYLAKAGQMGYPKKTCASYLALKNAYDHINSGNNTTITLGYFDHLYNNYMAETDIVVPEVGKVYTFQTDFQGETANRYLNDTNEGYDKNPINGQVNGLAMSEKTLDHYLENGMFWKCESVTGEGATFTSAMGNILGNRVIASSMNKVQRLTFGRGTELGKMYVRLGKNGKYLGVWNDKTKSTGSGVATSMDVTSTIAKTDTYTTDWIIEDVEAVGDKVYYINVTSDKPSTYEDIRNDVVVTGTINNPSLGTLTRKTSGLGFFVGTDYVVNNVQLQVNDLGTDFYQRGSEHAPTVTVDHTNKLVNVHYTFDYATAVPHIHEDAVTLNSKEGFGWPKADKYAEGDEMPTGANVGDYKVAAKQTFTTVINDFATANKEGENWKTEALDEAHYNTIHNAILAYKGTISDNDIVLPQNGKPVLLTNVFTNTNANEVYTNYTWNDNLTLKFAGEKCNTKLPTTPTKSYLWAVQRDDETSVTTITETEKGRTAYTGSDKWTDRESHRETIAADKTTDEFAGVAYEGANTTEAVTETQKTKVTTDEKWSVVADSDKIKTKANARYSGGSEHIENSYVDLNGSYVEIHTYDRDCILRTQTQTAVRKMDGETPLFWTNAQKTETTTDATEYPAYEEYGAATTTYQLVRYNVTEKAYNVQMARRYPSYYLSAIDGEGYIGRTSVSDPTAKMTDQHQLQFNVVFVRGTELGTVGILFLLSDANPRYMCGNLAGTKFDRYQIQYGYDTEGATQYTGVWSTDWGFVRATIDNEESHPVTAGEAEHTGTWEAPKMEGQVIKFYASNTTPTTAAEQTTDAQNSYGATNLPFAVSLPASAVQHIYIITGATRIWNNGVKTARTTLKWEDVKESLKVTVGGKERYILPREFPVLIHHNTDVQYYYCPTEAFAAYASADQIAAVKDAKAKNVLKGTLGRKNVPAGEQPYILSKTASTNLSDGKKYQTAAFYKMASGYQLPANRIYIDMNSLPIENDGETDESANNARALAPSLHNKRGGVFTINIEIDNMGMAIGDEDGLTTTIDPVFDVDANDEAIYDLSGRKVNAITSRGFYIKNGKKYIVR